MCELFDKGVRDSSSSIFKLIQTCFNQTVHPTLNCPLNNLPTFLVFILFVPQSVTKECHLYNISAIGYVAAAGRAMNCSGFPSERSTSTLKWYWPHEDEGGSTFDCQLLKDNDPIGKQFVDHFFK